MNTLKINGTTIPGIYVDAAVSYNKPAKRVQTFEVPGRNGNLIIDEGTFDNVLISYPVYEKDTFPAEFDYLVNWLASLEGYQRIECSNDPGHYRLGRFVVPQTPTVKRLNRDGYYQLSFDCKPQRWLLSGEEDTEIDANPQETYSGAMTTFNATPLDEISDLKLDIVAVQSGSGTPAPDNVRPITGWDGLNLLKAGRNLFKVGGSDGVTNGVRRTTNADGTISFSGNPSAEAAFQIQSNLYLPAGTYIFKGVPSGGGSSTYRARLNKGAYNTNQIGYDTGNGITFTLDEPAMLFIRFLVYAGAGDIDLKLYPLLQFASETDTSYVQSQYSATAISWSDSAGTVYRATLDAITGKLKVTHQMVDMGAINWVYQSSYAYFWPFSATYETPSTDMLSSAYEVSSTEKSSTQMGSAANYTIAKALGDTIVMVKNTDYTDASAFKTAMSGVQLLIPLATPTEYTLTSQEVALLTGVNNIWANTGDVSVTVTTPTNFINPGNFASKPIIRVYGAGNFRVGDVVVTITSHSQPYIDIDCEMQDCYYGSTNMNACVAFSGGEFPELLPGNNYVLLGTGITKLEVTPRWWEL